MTEWKQIKEEFLKYWTLDKIKEMTLEQYTNLDKKDSFTYWLETKTVKVLGIGGGSAYKFGIFKRNPESEQKELKNGQNSDENREYGWYSKYGQSKEEAFIKIKKLIIKIIEASQKKNFSEIDNIDLGNTFKWKLAYMYAPEGTLLRIAQDRAFYFLEKKHLKTNTKIISSIQERLINLKNNKKDFDQFSNDMWKEYQASNTLEIEFRNWLVNKLKENSIKKYIGRLKNTIPKKLKDINHIEEQINLFDFEYEDLEEILEFFKEGGKLDKWNIENTNREAKAALMYFLDFLNQDKRKDNDLLAKGNYKMPTQPLNQILYGSPGTGKTYTTIDKALKIIFEKEDEENEFDFKIKDGKNKEIEPSEKKYKNILLMTNESEKRKHLKGLFEYFKDDKRGQIEFVTFHQSYGYEEFVEGVKAKTTDRGIEYKIEAGIFKKVCEKAQEVVYKNDSIEFDSNSKIWKVSLAGSGDNKIKSECYKDGYIRFSYEGKFNENINDKSDLNIPLNALVNKINIGDIVVSLDTNKTINQIGIIESEYVYLENFENYRHARKVKWLLPEASVIDFYEINGNTPFASSAIHEINPNKEKFFKLIPNQNIEIKENNKTKNFILIIDEINRGNISKIFGELITLIEPSKRIGKDEEIKVKLPYSGKEFGVPKNLYIIGTMNTADRSIAPIDTALRRRFVFEEMAPKSDLLSENIEGVNLQSLLEAINTRIEYLYDRDHTIGHAYLIDVKTLPDLKFAFKNKIIPLLAEYFYEDWENIDLVLNQNGFIIPNTENKSYLSKKIEDKIRNKITYKVSDKNWEVENFQKIYDDSVILTKKDNSKTDEESK